MKKAIVEFDNADLGYDRKAVLSGISFSIERGDFFGIVGPNGSGKTTILKTILGILKPTGGSVRRDPKVRFGYVPQQQHIDEVYPLTVMEVAMMGRYPLLGAFSRPSACDRRFVCECLDHVGIADLANRHFRELSGGQKQRTLIARALAAEPDVLVLDEPTNDMDIGSEHAIMELLKHFNAEDRITVVMVSHLLNVVTNYAGMLALVDGGLRMVGRTQDVISSENLTSVYGVFVDVACCGGRNIVLTGGRG